MAHYSILNDDVLYHLCRVMHTNRLHGLINLSMVDRRTRMIAMPLLFSKIFYFPLWDEDQKPYIEIILKNRTILSFVRIFDFFSLDDHEFEHKIPALIFTLIASLPRTSTGGPKEMWLLLYSLPRCAHCVS
ncbi:hypothetical protein FRC19_009364 [Serendipita sp. 401]|nr:hypothetical protein FRC19_009364 [Serendipita sp. 401]